MKMIDAMMRRGVSENVFPGAVLLFSNQEEILFHKAYGRANIFSAEPMTPKTVFDLASLTKPLATTLAIMVLVQEKRLALEDPLGRIFPFLKDTPKADIQIRHLLCHTSGLPDYRPYYLELARLPAAQRKEALRRRLVKEPLISEVGARVLYSDIGFMFLEWVVETLTQTRLDRFVEETVYSRLETDGLFFINLENPLPNIACAATELCPWRGLLLNGVVHDENAYILGGVAGQAGLFGSASSIHRLLLELMRGYQGKHSLLRFETALVRRFLSPCADSERTPGFDTPSARDSSCGDFFRKDKTVGHLGFTGTSFWMDLEQSVIVILLTNRIHPFRSNQRIKKFRPMLHNEVMKQLAAL